MVTISRNKGLPLRQPFSDFETVPLGGSKTPQTGGVWREAAVSVFRISEFFGAFWRPVSVRLLQQFPYRHFPCSRPIYREFPQKIRECL